MKNTALIATAAAAAASLLIAACGSSSSSAPASSSTSSERRHRQARRPVEHRHRGGGGKFLGCMVTDTGGINDKSFNQSAWQGMQEAAAANPNITVKYLQSTTQSDYVPNINTFLSEKCGIIVTVGFLMADRDGDRGQGEPEPGLRDRRLLVRLGLPDRHQGEQHRPAGVQHRAGRLPRRLPGRGHDKTGKVATFGGEDFGTVTIYMDGFWDGVQYYNKQHKTNVQVLGWNEQTQKGEFTGDFTNQTKGQTVTQTFISEGADIIFPVAGNVGLGAAKAVQQADTAGGQGQHALGGHRRLRQRGAVLQVLHQQRDQGHPGRGEERGDCAAQSGSFKGGNYVGTLANGGAVLSPFHDFASKVPAALQAELKTIETGIENGSIETPTKSPV